MRIKKSITAATAQDMIDAFESKLAEFGVESATDISCNEAILGKRIDKAVQINEEDFDEWYQDSGGGFGDPGDTYTLAEIKEIWNEDCESDPSMAQYTNFYDWWKDTQSNYLNQIAASESITCSKEVDIDDLDYDQYYVDNDGGFGEPGETYSLGEIKNYWNHSYDKDYTLRQYDSFDEWWADTALGMDQLID